MVTVTGMSWPAWPDAATNDFTSRGELIFGREAGCGLGCARTRLSAPNGHVAGSSNGKARLFFWLVLHPAERAPDGL